MNSIGPAIVRVAPTLIAILTLTATDRCAASTPPPVPVEFQDVYNTLNTDLSAFNTTLNGLWNSVPYPVLWTAALTNADANTGPMLVNSGYMIGVQNQLNALKAMGVKAVMVECGFPMLYQPFFTSQTQYQQFVNFYSQVAANVRAAGLRLVVENNTLLTSHVQAGWNAAPFFATLNWTQYQAARAQTAAVIAQTLKPDYMVVLEEPDTEALMSGQALANTVSGSVGMLSQILTAVHNSGVTGIQYGAGAGTWLTNFQQFFQAYVAQPLDFIDFHIYPANHLPNLDYLANALTIASTAASAGKPVTMTESWIWKIRDSELGVLSADVIEARNAYSFWAPLDTYFIQTMEKMANYMKMPFYTAFNTDYFFAYQDYNSILSWSPAQILAQEAQLVSQANTQALYTTTGTGYYSSIVSPADTIPPTSPTNLTAGSGSSTGTYLNWNPSTDNIGVAGYYVYRNGVNVATTSQIPFQDTGLTGSTTYSYYLVAFDLGGNLSPPSAQVSIMTLDVTPPSMPGNPAAAATSTKQINFMWMPSSDDVAIGSYRIFQGNSPGILSQVAIGSATTLSYGAYPLTPSITYYFAVEAVDTAGNVSPMSAVVAATTLALPSPPTRLAAAPASPNQIVLTWTAAKTGMPVAAYYLFRGNSPANLIQLAGVAGTSYTNRGLTPATTYFYAVQTIDTGGNLSPLSGTVKCATLPGPSVPKNLVGTPVTTKQISLTWSASTGGATISGYRIYRGTTQASLLQVAAVSTTSFNDYNLNPATTYYYAVQSMDTSGNISALSGTISVTTLALPSPPPNVAATAASKTQVNVTWGPAHTGMPLASYHVYRGASSASLAQLKVVNGTQTSCIDYLVTAGTTYYYAVQTADTGGNLSALSPAVSVTTPK